MFNEKMIRKYIDTYKRIYKEANGVKPKSWFSYLSWLSSFSPCGNFEDKDIELVKSLME